MNLVIYIRSYVEILLSLRRQYRRECLFTLNTDLNTELDYLDQFSEDNPKNYQIWYHRRAVVEHMGVAFRELKFCDQVFSVDAKNYHAWAHRLDTFVARFLYINYTLSKCIRLL